MTTIDHAAEARAMIRNAHKAVAKATINACLAEAHVHAQLALVEAQREANEQARIANLIALGQFRVGVGDLPHLRHLAVEPKGENSLQPVAEIREALGL